MHRLNPQSGAAVCWSMLVISCFMSQKLALAQYGDVARVPEELVTGFESITAAQAREFLEVLAGPSFEGRGTGQPGFIKAAHWVAGKVAEFGLQPIGDGGTYFQFMPLTRRFADLTECKIVGSEGLVISGEGNLGFERYTEDGVLDGEVVFLRFQGADPSLPDDLDLQDKIIVYTADAESAASAPWLIARKRPGAALRMVESTPVSTPQTLFPGRRSRSTSVSGTIAQAAARQLAAALGVDGNWAESANIVSTGMQVSIHLRLREEETAAPNVVAWLEGSDPLLRDEYVVVAPTSIIWENEGMSGIRERMIMVPGQRPSSASPGPWPPTR